MAGTSWLKPVAIRRADSAEGPGPPLEIVEAMPEQGSSAQVQAILAMCPVGAMKPAHRASALLWQLHLFSSLAPSAFVPTSLVQPAAEQEAVEVRLLQGLHRADIDVSHGSDQQPSPTTAFATPQALLHAGGPGRRRCTASSVCLVRRCAPCATEPRGWRHRLWLFNAGTLAASRCRYLAGMSEAGEPAPREDEN